MRKSITAILWVVIAVLSSCKKEDFVVSENSNDQFKILHNGAFTPIWVRGNVASGTILVYIQGGPGYNSLDFAAIDYPGWKETLEKDFGVAYYDQLGTGMRQGDVDPEKITMNDWTEQLHEVGSLLKEKYKTDVVFMGHSFGGVVAMRYLLKYGDEAVADKYICMNSPATTDADSDAEMRWEFRRDFLVNLSVNMLAKGEDKEFWESTQSWLDANPKIETDDQRKKWNELVEENYDRHFDDKEVGFRDYLKVIFSSPYSAGPAEANGKVLSTLEKNLIAEEKSFDLMSKLGNINADLLLLTGEMDDICPPEELGYMHKLVPSKTAIIPEASHETYLHQPELFRKAIKEFVTE